MEKLPAKTGWIWIKEGFALFRKQPAEISTLFLTYMLLMVVLNYIPLLGQVLPLFLTPIFSMCFMQACSNIEQGRRVYPNLLLVGFRSPALKNLLILGSLYLMVGVIALAVSTLAGGDSFWTIISNQAAPDAKEVPNSSLLFGMITSAALSIPAAMAFWYAAPLIMWKKMGVSKAIFYSFFAVWREIKAFTVYGLAWAAIILMLPFIGVLIAAIVGTASITMIVLSPLWIALMTVIYCSFYPTYTHIFGKPEDELPLPQQPTQ